MNQLSPAAAERQIIETLERLTAPSRRMIVCGDDGLCAALAADGVHAAVVEGGTMVRGRHVAGIIAGARSRAALATAIRRIMPYLADAATLVVVIDGGCGGLGPEAGPLLAQHGFRIEAGVRCQRGLLLSARRDAAATMAAAA